MWHIITILHVSFPPDSGRILDFGVFINLASEWLYLQNALPELGMNPAKLEGIIKMRSSQNGIRIWNAHPRPSPTKNAHHDHDDEDQRQ